MTAGLLDRETFVGNLRAVGQRAYHDKHPFHIAMNEGRLVSRSFARLGGQSLLLPMQYSNERRRHSLQLPTA